MNHQEPESYSAEQLATIHRQAEELLQEASGSSPRREPDGLIFDWEFPELARPNILIFIAEVRYPDDKARVRFQIDLAKLQTPELEELHRILARRHAGVDDRYSLLRSIEWMLRLSLSQTASHLTEDEQKNRARRLLLLA